ncbi:MAG: transposase [Planctomycetes bacterium]|nr:transposase [Planctomycetota bacterium]
MPDPLAFLLTFRTYGTWLHGDDRGAVDLEHNTPGTPLLRPDAAREQRERRAMKAEPMILNERLRSVVDAAIIDECAYRKWNLLERAVRSNHVHIAVAFAGLRPERMLQKITARATRWLRERGLVHTGQPVWADRPGSRRYLWSAKQVNAAIDYVREGQDTPR